VSFVAESHPTVALSPVAPSPSHYRT